MVIFRVISSAGVLVPALSGVRIMRMAAEVSTLEP